MKRQGMESKLRECNLGSYQPEQKKERILYTAHLDTVFRCQNRWIKRRRNDLALSEVSQTIP